MPYKDKEQAKKRAKERYQSVKCNTSLGYLKEDIIIIESMIKYIKKFN